MPASPYFRKRNQGPRVNKNDLKVSRNENEEQQKARAGTLRERFARVRQLRVDLRMETSSGAILEQSKREIALDEPLLLDITCEGGCGNGLFLLKSAVEALLETGQELREGMGICQASSYQDPKVPCNTKLFYRIEARYD